MDREIMPARSARTSAAPPDTFFSREQCNAQPKVRQRTEIAARRSTRR